MQRRVSGPTSVDGILTFPRSTTDALDTVFTAGEAHGAKQGDLLYTFLTATHSPYCEAD